MISRHVQVTGRVQGVGFREWTARQARAKGVAGWVRNCSDGSVEAVVSGPDAMVEALIAALHEGPPAARVANLRVSEAAMQEGSGFRIEA